MNFKKKCNPPSPGQGLCTLHFCSVGGFVSLLHSPSFSVTSDPSFSVLWHKTSRTCTPAPHMVEHYETQYANFVGD